MCKSLTIRGLNALAAVISTPLAAPVIAATRLRGGTANSARGAASLAAEAISTARRAGCTGQIVVRIDSAYYSAAVLGAIRRGGACFSVTVRMDPKIRAAITAIGEDAWTPVTYPRAIWDEDQGRLISDAEVAEVPDTAFASKKGKAITARLIVRRVKDLNRKAAGGQDKLFTIWRYHALFTDSPFELIQAEAQHRDHAIVEQVFADLTSGPLAHLPSVLQPGRGDRLAPQRVHQVRVEAVILQQPDQPAPPERGLERHRRPGRQIADQPQDRLGPVRRVLVQLHRPVLGDYRHLGPLAVHVDADLDRHCRVSPPELGISHPERPATGLSWEEARPL